MSNNRVVLAFSGGLDTSFCVPYLIHERGLEVHTVLVNTGGFSKGEALEIEKRAFYLGAKSHKTVDAVEEYYQKGIKYLLFGNILKNATYPLSVSSERAFQALAVLQHLRELDAQYVAHGSTGAGNDQIRFDLIFEILSPNTTILAPIRELSLSRAQEIEYLKKHGVNLSWEKAKYSINQGLWGTSIGGAETLTSHLGLPKEAYPVKVEKNGSEKIVIEFYKGEPVALNGERLLPIELIDRVNKIGALYGIGRDIHVGDTIIGLKGRVGFEAPAALILIKAHHLLEKHVLTKGQLYWKEQLANIYGEMLHEARYLDPLMRNIETFMEETQQFVTGSVEVEILPYHFSIVGASSKYDLMNSKFGEYGELNSAFTPQDIIGFTKVIANPLKIYYSVHDKD